MTRTYESKNLEWFIDTVVIRDIKNMVKHGPRYLSFQNMCSAIEFLGACLDDYDFHQERRSGIRFSLAIDELFSPINQDYSRYKKELWSELRCGILHAMIPQVTFDLTEVGKLQSGESHLAKVTIGDQTKILLVCENLQADLEKAAEDIKERFRNNLIENKSLEMTVFQI